MAYLRSGLYFSLSWLLYTWFHHIVLRILICKKLCKCCISYGLQLCVYSSKLLKWCDGDDDDRSIIYWVLTYARHSIEHLADITILHHRYFLNAWCWSLENKAVLELCHLGQGSDQKTAVNAETHTGIASWFSILPTEQPQQVNQPVCTLGSSYV